MKKKMIEPEKSWFVKEPAKIEEILEAAGLFVNNELLVKAIYCDINRVFTLNNYAESFVRKSVIVNHYSKRRRYKIKLLDTVLNNKWLFYTQDIEMGADTLIQPVFDMAKMTERKINSLIKAILNNDYARLQKLAPNEVNRFDKYSNCLFKEEPGGSLDLNLHVTNVPSTPARDGSELIPESEPKNADTHGQSTDHELTMRGQCTDHGLTMRDLARIEDTRVAIESRDKREGDKRFNLEGKKDSGPLVRETEPEPSLPPYQKTELDVITKERSWEEYLDNLKLDSKEMQSLLPYAAEDRPMIENNFEEFIFHMKNRCNFRKKDECQLTKSDAGKNEYIYNLLKNKSERRNLVKHIQDSIEGKRKREFTHGKPGYPFDFFNKQGQRISSGRIVPDDAPPRPSNEHFWNGTKWNHR